MSNSMNTIDLVHSYLTESRILGLHRKRGYQDKHYLILNHDEVRLAEITATDTKVKVTSTWLKELSANNSESTTIELSDPQGLEKLISLLETIASIYNTFFKRLYFHKTSLCHYLKYPEHTGGEAKIR